MSNAIGSEKDTRTSKNTKKYDLTFPLFLSLWEIRIKSFEPKDKTNWM